MTTRIVSDRALDDLLRRALRGGAKLRQGKHYVLSLPDGRKVALARSPGTTRAALNGRKRLERYLREIGL